MLNSFIKLFGLIIVFGSFPIWCRLIMYTYPNTNIKLYSVADMLFFGISLHVSCIYELINSKKETPFISFSSLIFIIVLFFYIIYTVLYMINCQNIDMLVIWFVIISLLCSIFCHVILIKDNSEKNLY